MKYLYTIVMAMLVLASCSENERMEYTDTPGIYFPDYVVGADSLVYSFRMKDTDRDTIQIHVKLLGDLLDEAGEYEVIVSENSSAVAGKHYETLQHRFTYEADKSVSSFPVVVMKPGAELDEATVMLELSLKATESLSLGYPDRVNMRLMITNQLVKPAYWDMPLALYFGEYSKVKHQRCILLMGHDFPLTKEELIGWGGLNYYSYWMQQGRVVCEYYATHTEYDEDGNLVALDTVFNTYNSLDNRTKAKYASSFSGNPNFRQQVYNWVVQDTKLDLCHSVIGTPGGSGAVSSTILNVLDEGQTLIIPHIAWGNYKSMATIANCKVQAYQMFDGDAFNITSFKETCREVMARQGKVLAIINDPCHNPTGYSMTVEEWNQVIDFCNELSNEGPLIILDDIAYIDYSYNLERSRDYMNAFNRMNDQVMIVVAFSCSKTLTSYGLRCGGAVILAKNQEDVRSLEILMEKHARASWSNIPNAAMENFVKVTTEHKDEFNAEKSKYVDLLRQRCEVFKKEADECGLTYYPYKEGFFVTLKVEDDDLLTRFHEAMLAQDIYTIKVNKGIRVALCSLSVEKCQGLAFKMKEILDSLK